jgi:sugar lactone lactonase YvrE
MSNRAHIERVDPPAGISGGEVSVEFAKLSPDDAKTLNVNFDGSPAHVTAATHKRALVLVPKLDSGGGCEVTLSVGEGQKALGEEPKAVGKPALFTAGKKLSGGIHPVTNPAFDPSDGSLFVTRSGSRGEHIPVSLFRIGADESVTEFSGDIANPTSIAFDKSGRMFVTSRLEGTVYRVTPLKEIVEFASDLGIATGLAFNRDGEMFVGDRSGTIYRVNEIGEARAWATLEPSVSAYHLAFGPDDFLYVTGPTVCSFDEIIRFNENGEPNVFFRGLGRPQGLAFDRDGNLYVAASLRGRRGIVRIARDGGTADVVVAGMNLVGLAFGPNGEMVVATNDSVYSLSLGIHGTLLG